MDKPSTHLVEIARANDRLRAAAPDLLEAAQGMLDPANRSNGMPFPHVWAKLRAAIAKATA